MKGRVEELAKKANANFKTAQKAIGKKNSAGEIRCFMKPGDQFWVNSLEDIRTNFANVSPIKGSFRIFFVC